MFSIVVLNKDKSKNSQADVLAGGEGLLHLQTCLRSMYIITGMEYEELKQKNPQNILEYSKYESFKALEYLVQVVSGLKSPVVGETEVFGQFKKQILPQLDHKKELQEPLQFAMNIAKFIRTKHLVGGGSQTYGSMVRRLLKGENNILFIGSGVLAESIYPWVKGSKNIIFSVRNPNKVKIKNEKVLSLNEKFNCDFPINVVVCAPVSSDFLGEYLKDVNVNHVIDLREESKEDPLNYSKLYDLQTVFKEIKETNQSQKDLVKTINSEIETQISQKLVKFRPYGWDDLCQ